jgi:hypothetical protein
LKRSKRLAPFCCIHASAKAGRQTNVCKWLDQVLILWSSNAASLALEDPLSMPHYSPSQVLEEGPGLTPKNGWPWQGHRSNELRIDGNEPRRCTAGFHQDQHQWRPTPS